jgi:hypothetical protein
MYSVTFTKKILTGGKYRIGRDYMLTPSENGYRIPKNHLRKKKG